MPCDMTEVMRPRVQNSFIFLCPPPFIMKAGKWPLMLQLEDNVSIFKFDQLDGCLQIFVSHDFQFHCASMQHYKTDMYRSCRGLILVLGFPSVTYCYVCCTLSLKPFTFAF